MSRRHRVAQSRPSAATVPTTKPQHPIQQQQQNASESESQEYAYSSCSDEFRGCTFTEDEDDASSTHAADAADHDAQPPSPAAAPAQPPPRPTTTKGLKPGDVRTKLTTPHGHKPKPRDGPLSAIHPKRTTVSTAKGPRKRLLYRQGEGALLDVYNTQKGTELLLPRAPFARLVKEISDAAAAAPLNWTKDGVEALQQYTESFLTTHLSMGQDVACHAWRETLRVGDLELLRSLKRKESYGVGAGVAADKGAAPQGDRGDRRGGGSGEVQGAEVGPAAPDPVLSMGDAPEDAAVGDGVGEAEQEAALLEPAPPESVSSAEDAPGEVAAEDGLRQVEHEAAEMEAATEASLVVKNAPEVDAAEERCSEVKWRARHSAERHATSQAEEFHMVSDGWAPPGPVRQSAAAGERGLPKRLSRKGKTSWGRRLPSDVSDLGVKWL